MLSSITLSFTEHDNLVLPIGGITIFVGPNNSGKSLLLKEIESAFNTHPFPTNTLILKDYDVRWQGDAEIEKVLAQFHDSRDKNIPIGHKIIGRINPNGRREASHIDVDNLKRIAKERQDKYWWATQFLKWGVLRLDGRSRFNLTNDQQGGDLLTAPENVLAHLFQDDCSRREVEKLVKEAFGLSFGIDPTNLGSLRIKLSREEPLADEQSLNEATRNYYKNALHIKDASDGVQAFTGIIMSVMSGNFHTILIDEPEAFLHPPLARKLGANLATLATKRNGALLASTHSADFLMGCIQATKDVRVVRLEYVEGRSRGRMVDPAELENLFKNPLMRSANAISGLFYDGVVVCESDNDRTFYSEINHRLASTHKNSPSILFINAQNKQTLKSIIEPLRKFGVPAVGIPDIDILKEGGKVWLNLLASAQIPNALHTGFATQRAEIKNCFERAGRDMKADGGINALPTSDKKAAEQLLDTLTEYGIFIVPGGELENWLLSLGTPGKKTEWTIGMLERLGLESNELGYVPLGVDDVWGFMTKIIAWIGNPARKGVA